MTEATSNTTGKTVGAAILGGLAGLGIGLLFAPRSGRETRAQIHQKAEHTKQKVEESAEQVKQKTKAGLHKAATIKDNAVESAKSVGRKAKEEAQDTQDEARNI